MSQTETNPLFNPTITQYAPKQQQQQMQPFVTDFGIGIGSQTDSLTLNCNQMDWIKISQKNKYLKTVSWLIDSSVAWFSQEIDLTLILSLSQVGKDYQVYFSFDRLLISIQPTHQAFFQGNTKIAYDPSPSNTYYTTVLGAGFDQAAFYQFQTVDFSPKSTQAYNFLLPMLAPFAYLSNSRNPSFNSATENYLNNYNMGRLLSSVFSQLTTKGVNTSIQYNVSAQILGLKTEGMTYP